MKVQFPVGTKFIPYYDKHKRVATIVDIYTTTNMAGEIVSIDYKTEYIFGSHTVSGSEVAPTIARSEVLDD